MKILEKRIKEIEEKELALKNRLKKIKQEKNRLNQKEISQRRKTETRMKILAGAVVLREASQDDLIKIADKMSEKDKKWFLDNAKDFILRF